MMLFIYLFIICHIIIYNINCNNISYIIVDPYTPSWGENPGVHIIYRKRLFITATIYPQDYMLCETPLF
jgi:hypothetical protein